MNFIWSKVTEWLREMLVSGITSNLSGLFDGINDRVSDIAVNVGATPQAWNSGIFSMIQNLSDNVVVPIAGIILTFVMCLELIQMLIDRNNMHIQELILLFFCIKSIFFQQIADNYSRPCPWDISSCALYSHRKRRKIISVFLSKENCCFFNRVCLPEIPGDCMLAVDTAIPFLKRVFKLSGIDFS